MCKISGVPFNQPAGQENTDQSDILWMLILKKGLQVDYGHLYAHFEWGACLDTYTVASETKVNHVFEILANLWKIKELKSPIYKYRPLCPFRSKYNFESEGFWILSEDTVLYIQIHIHITVCKI